MSDTIVIKIRKKTIANIVWGVLLLLSLSVLLSQRFYTDQCDIWFLGDLWFNSVYTTSAWIFSATLFCALMSGSSLILLMQTPFLKNAKTSGIKRKRIWLISLFMTLLQCGIIYAFIAVHVGGYSQAETHRLLLVHLCVPFLSTPLVLLVDFVLSRLRERTGRVKVVAK